MPTPEDVLNAAAADILQLSNAINAIGNASVSTEGLIKIADVTAPLDASIPTIAFLKNKNILGTSGNAAGGLPETQQEQLAALPATAILSALSTLPANLLSLVGKVIAVNSNGNGFEIITAPVGSGGGGGDTVPVSSAINRFTGNGTATQFTLSQAPINSNAVIVTVSGVTIDPALYSILGTILTFTDAPPITIANAIAVYHLGSNASLPDGSITTAKINDRAITLAKIANGTPGKYLKYNTSTGVIEETDITASVADNTISTIKLANNAVTLAKMANGTAGKFLKFNSSTGVLEETTVAHGAMNFIARYTISSSIVQLDIENASMFDGTYKHLMIFGSGIRPVTQSAGWGHLCCQVKVGTAYQTGSGDYNSSTHSSPNNGDHTVNQHASSMFLVPIWSGNYHWSDFYTVVINPSGVGSRAIFLSFGNETNDGGQTGNSQSAGLYVSPSSLKGLRIFYEGINMSAGNIDIYGLK